MTKVNTGSGPSMYELTVVGEMGPVLENALTPRVTRQAEILTIVCARADDPFDLIDLLGRLDARGLEVTEISLSS